MKKWSLCLLAAALLAAMPASALEYTLAAPTDHLFATPTSDNTIYEQVSGNIDRSKDAALIPPVFGSPTSYLPGSGDYLTPNLAPGALSGGQISGGAVSALPSVPAAGGGTAPATGYTEVTTGLYYGGGYLATLKIPAIGVNVKVYQGTDAAALAKGAGHFSGTSVWDGNIALAGHNRGANAIFGKLHTLEAGDRITLTTKLGTRSYRVYSVSKISVYDTTILDPTADNLLTLVTCVANEPSYRCCVRAIEI